MIEWKVYVTAAILIGLIIYLQWNEKKRQQREKEYQDFVDSLPRATNRFEQ